MFCFKCGKEVKEQDKFCPSCGTYLQGVDIKSGTEQTGQVSEQPTVQYIVAEPKRLNLFAILSLCFFWTFLFGLAFGIVGLVQSKTLKTGTAMSAVGIALSICVFLFALI